MARIYVAGDSGTPKVGYFDIDTLTYTPLPDPRAIGWACSIAVLADDDLWVGIDNSQTGYPVVCHWNGSAWTEYILTEEPYHYDHYRVNDLIVGADDVVYAYTEHELGNYDDIIYRWTGSEWVVHVDQRAEQGVIMWESTGSDMWFTGNDVGNVAHFNGTIIDERIDIDGGAALNGISKRETDGLVYAIGLNGNLYKRTGVNTWQFVVDVHWRALPFEGASIWRDPETDNLWIAIEDNGIAVWDGGSLSKEYPFPADPDCISGVVEDGNSYVCVGFDDSRRICTKDITGAGSWTNTYIGIRVNALAPIATLQTPPYLQNQDPAPDSTDNAEDTPVYSEVVDDNGDLVVSTVTITIDGEVAWTSDAPANGWSGHKLAVANGYYFKVFPHDYYDPGAHTVRIQAQDDFGNTLDDTYSFYTEDLDVGWCGRVQWGAFEWGQTQWGAAEVCRFFAESVSPSPISTAGGETITISGEFVLTYPVRVHLGPLGTTEDPLCYGGQGLGYECLSLDGVTLQCISPPLPKGTAIATVTDGEVTQSLGAISVVERNWPGKLHPTRKSFSPWVALGARRLEEEIGE